MNKSTIKKVNFPISSKCLDEILIRYEIDLDTISIRELNRLVDKLSVEYSIKFLRFEFGVPGINSSPIGPSEEIKVIKNNIKISSTYPPFDGLQRLKKATSDFLEKYINIQVPSSSCIPTVGAMHGGFICQAICGRRILGAKTILYLDPGFPVNKLQAKFLGLEVESIDLYDYRGIALINKMESCFIEKNIGGVIWSSPNNPSWVCLKEAELEGIGKLLTKYDVIGIEDSAYLGMDYRTDYSEPGKPPYIPTIANYTKNYFIIISSSKIFSYAGQRIAVTIISPDLMNKRYENLKKYFDTDKVGHAFIHGGIYPTTAGVAQTAQHALAALFEAASIGEYNFLDDVKIYRDRAKEVKSIFKNNDFKLVYDQDMGDPISDGFYFTITKTGYKSSEILFHMLRHGMAGIPLNTTGSNREGIRICVSNVSVKDYGILSDRLNILNSYLNQL